MTDLTIVRLDALRLPRRGPVCPVCGRVHGLGRWVFGLALLLAAVLALPVGRPVRADAGAVRQVPFEHLRPAAAADPDPAAAAPPAPTTSPTTAPTVLAVPDTAVVWNRLGAGVYLWDRPGGAILGFIENGLMVRLAERWEGYGGTPFGEAEFEGVIGWVDMRSVHRLVVPEGGFTRVSGGAYLYDAPGGKVLVWLPAGTPVAAVVDGEAGWVAVELLVGGEAGWIAAGGLEGP